MFLSRCKLGAMPALGSEGHGPSETLPSLGCCFENLLEARDGNVRELRPSLTAIRQR